MNATCTPFSPRTIETARAAAAQHPAWLRAIDRAALMAPISQFERLADGHYRIVSARSGAAYVATRTGCTCPAGLAGRPCWHRAAVALAERAARERRIPDCPACGAAMVEALTPGGERAYACPLARCGKTLHADTFDQYR